jgi:HEAT repeat protein
MSRFIVFGMWLLASVAGCNRFSTPARQVQVPDGGPPVLTAEERAAHPEMLTAMSQPRLISPAAYLRAIGEPQGLKPFEQWTEQEAAKDALGRIGAAAVPPLIDALRDRDPAVRLKAIEVLGRMGEDAGAAVPELVRLLDDPDIDVRKAAARTLGRIGPAAQTAVPSLMRKLFEPPPASVP